MHETHIIRGIIEAVENKLKKVKSNPRKISKVNVVIGKFTGSTKGSFRETYKILVKDTVLEKARLNIKEDPGTKIFVESIELKNR